MPLTPGELDRCRAELGYNLLSVGAEPYVGVSALFSQVVAPFLREGADTTSATAVTAVTAGAFVTLTVASATGIVLHERVAVDVDDYLEMATVRSVSGTSVGVILKKAHAGTYPVTVDGGLQKVRECLAAIFKVHQNISELEGTGALKQVDEIQWYDTKGKSHLQLLNDQLEHWRNQLSAAFNVERRNERLGGCVSLY